MQVESWAWLAWLAWVSWVSWVRRWADGPSAVWLDPCLGRALHLQGCKYCTHLPLRARLSARLLKWLPSPGPAQPAFSWDGMGLQPLIQRACLPLPQRASQRQLDPTRNGSHLYLTRSLGSCFFRLHRPILTRPDLTWTLGAPEAACS